MFGEVAGRFGVLLCRIAQWLSVFGGRRFTGHSRKHLVFENLIYTNFINVIVIYKLLAFYCCFYYDRSKQWQYSKLCLIYW